MCIAIVNTKTLLPLETFTTSFKNNKDGIGFAFTDGEQVRTVRTLDQPEKLWERYAKERETNPHPMLVHSRISTHGVKDLGNVHPFKITPRLALIHNGIVSAPTYRKHRSDTWHLVDLLRRLRDPEDTVTAGSELHQWLTEFAGYTSKFALLHSDGRTAIINESKGNWEGDTWYSNATYKESCTVIDRGGFTYRSYWDDYTKPSKTEKTYYYPSQFEKAFHILKTLDEPIKGTPQDVIDLATDYARSWNYRDLHALYTDVLTWKP